MLQGAIRPVVGCARRGYAGFMNRLAIPLLTLLVIVGCATSRGGLYEDTVEVEKRQTESQGGPPKEPRPPEPEKSGLEIVSHPRGAAVYLDGRYEGDAPLLLEGLAEGRYRLTVQEEGYYPHTGWVDYGGGYLEYRADLQPITGMLLVDVSPSGAVVEVDGRALPSGSVHELAVGAYTARVRLFGYEDHTAVFEIAERSLTRAAVRLAAAPFRLEHLFASHTAFNPGNPGKLGQVKVRFQVSTFGTGQARVRDAEGREVWRRPLGRFTSREQELSWDGRAASGAPLPDGPYTLVVEGSPEGTGGPDSAGIPLLIDSSRRLSYRLLWSGGAGLLYVPSPEVLPRGSSQFSTLLVSHMGASAGGPTFRTPWDLGLRLGMGEDNDLELDLHGGVILGYGEVVPWYISAAFKRPLFRPGGALESALLIKLGHQTVRTDSFASFSGLTVGLSASVAMGSLRLFVSPELTLTFWDVSYTDPGWPPPAFTAWGYAKGGVALDMDPWTVGVSASVRSLPFDRGFGLALPVQGGLELHWMIPDTQLILTAALTGEARGVGSYYFSGGVGLGLLD